MATPLPACRIVMSHATILATLLWLLVTSLSRGVKADDPGVIWTDLVNVTVDGSVLRKTRGGDGWDEEDSSSRAT
jgi:hypothetical protein